MTCLLRFTGGSLGLLDANWVSPEKQREVVLLGSGGQPARELHHAGRLVRRVVVGGARRAGTSSRFIRGEGEGTADALRPAQGRADPRRAGRVPRLHRRRHARAGRRTRRRPRARRRARDPRVAALGPRRAACSRCRSRRRRVRWRVCRDPLRHPRLQRGAQRRPPDGAAAPGRTQPRRARDPRGRRLDRRYGATWCARPPATCTSRSSRTAATADSASPSTPGCGPP